MRKSKKYQTPVMTDNRNCLLSRLREQSGRDPEGTNSHRSDDTGPSGPLSEPFIQQITEKFPEAHTVDTTQ
jgi:hypothetical protein